MEKKITYKKPKWLRRFSSALLDLIIFLVLTLLLSLASDPLASIMLHGKDAKQTYYDFAVSTHLYTYDENNNIVKISDITTFDANLGYFYSNCINKQEEYNLKKKDKADMFHLDESTNKYVENAYDYNDFDIKSKYIVFYNEVRDYCVNNYLDDYLNQFDDYLKAKKTYTMTNYLSILLSTTVSLLLVYLLIPFINKNYKTVGKMAFRLKVISISNIDPKPTKLQILFRQLITIFFEYILSISTIALIGFPIPVVFIISIVLLLVTKYNQSLHDLICQTIVIDDYPDLGPIDQRYKYEINFTNVKESDLK